MVQRVCQREDVVESSPSSARGCAVKARSCRAAEPNRHRMSGVSVCALLTALMLSVPGCVLGSPTLPPRESGPWGARGDGSAPEPVRAADPQPFTEGGTPTFWSWQEPLGHAADHPRFVGMVLDFTGRTTPEESADRVIRQVTGKRLGPGEVCLVLLHFGMGHGDPTQSNRTLIRAPALFRHWCDGVPHREAQLPGATCEALAAEDSAAQWWMTPWMRHGLAECRDWMARFIARYRARQAADPRIPDPARFHFDSEWWVVPQYSPRGAVEAFAAMQKDDRWATEPIAGHDGRTMAELYAEAGSPRFDPARTWWELPNREWATWYATLCLTATDAAMRESAYNQIRAAWPLAMSSNYHTSANFDGEGTPPRVVFAPNRNVPWFRYGFRGSGDLQAPYIYWASGDLVTEEDSLHTLTMRRARWLLDGCMHSFGGPHRNIVPWMEVIGCHRDRRTGAVTMTTELFRDQLALCRGRGIQEIILWSNDSTQRSDIFWNDVVRVLGQVWDARLHEYRIVTGSLRGPGHIDRLRFAERVGVDVASDPEAGGRHRVRIDGDFVASMPSRAFAPRLAVQAEIFGLSDTATIRAQVQGHAVLMQREAGDPQRDRWIGRATLPGPSRVAPGEPVTVRLEIEDAAAFVATIDLMQCFGTDEPPDAGVAAVPSP